MKHTLIVMSVRDELEPETKATVERLRHLGAIFLKEQGSTCVAFARCKALSGACKVLRERPDIDMVLMLDDDMDVDSLTANAVVSHARHTHVPASAAYATKEATLAGTRYKAGTWLVGLGCLAIPRAALLALEVSSESFEEKGEVFSAFTWAGAEAGRWVGEDFRLCQRLGGVHLLPLVAGHVKKAVLWVDDETLRQIGEAQ